MTLDTTAHRQKGATRTEMRPKGTKLQIHNTQQGQIGIIAPTATLTPHSAADAGYAGDYWQFNSKGKLVRTHRQSRKTLFTPSCTQCPAPMEKWRTTAGRPAKTTSTVSANGQPTQSTAMDVEMRSRLQDQERQSASTLQQQPEMSGRACQKGFQVIPRPRRRRGGKQPSQSAHESAASCAITQARLDKRHDYGGGAEKGQIGEEQA